MTTPTPITKKDLNALNAKRDAKNAEREARLQKKLDDLNARRNAKREKDNAKFERQRRVLQEREYMLAGEDWQQQQQLDRHEGEIGSLNANMDHAKRVANDHEKRLLILEAEEEIPVWGSPSDEDEGDDEPMTETPTPQPTPQPTSHNEVYRPVEEPERKREGGNWVPIAIIVALGIVILFLFGIFITTLTGSPPPQGQGPIHDQATHDELVRQAVSSATSGPGGIPDGGIVKRINANRIEVTLGKGIGSEAWSDPVYTGEAKATVYTFTRPDGSQLPDGVEVKFPNGDNGRASASQNYNGKWDEQESPLRFKGPQGTVVAITWTSHAH